MCLLYAIPTPLIPPNEFIPSHGAGAGQTSSEIPPKEPSLGARAGPSNEIPLKEPSLGARAGPSSEIPPKEPSHRARAGPSSEEEDED